MKKIILGIVLLSAMFSTAMAQYVSGYTKSNGTYVSGYYRSNANSTQYDNYSTRGNTNPYTGKVGTKRAYY